MESLYRNAGVWGKARQYAIEYWYVILGVTLAVVVFALVLLIGSLAPVAKAETGTTSPQISFPYRVCSDYPMGLIEIVGGNGGIGLVCTRKYEIFLSLGVLDQGCKNTSHPDVPYGYIGMEVCL